MARLPRLTLPGQAHHIIQRGNNRQPIFIDSQDRQQLLDVLFESAHKFEVAVHGYVLMDNHFHLLATPETATGLPHMMQAVGRSYVRAFNQAHQRSGTLWEGRYRSTLIQPEPYVLACMAYMDLNPVRSGLVATPGDFAWSSYGHLTGMHNDRLITPHAMYWQLGNTPFAREAAYTSLVEAGISVELQADLTESALKGWPLGGNVFIDDLQKLTQRRVTKSSAGRPVSTQKLPLNG